MQVQIPYIECLGIGSHVRPEKIGTLCNGTGVPGGRGKICVMKKTFFQESLEFSEFVM